ncbi:MAG TPA: 2-phospho-L-lactate guanylyltransferase [Solirubrobacteraceae bacterium]
MRTVAVLPVKRFARAKQRLRGALDEGARERLAAAMAGDVLDVVCGCGTFERVVVVTAEPAISEQAAACGAHVVEDRDEAGQSAAAAVGVLAAREIGAQRVLLVPGDTPCVRAGDLEVVLARDEPVVIVPDRHGTGTNALLLTPPGAIAPAYGPGSRRRHETAAAAAGVDHAVLEVPALGLDVDTPDDLAALRAGGTPGPRTAAALEAPATAPS